MFYYLSILLLIQMLGGGHCAVTLLQPPAVAARQGSSVNLSCHMQSNGEKLDRVNVYWLIPGNNSKVIEYLHPRPKHESTRRYNARLTYPDYDTDLSLTIEDVQLTYTDTYICETSLLRGLQSTKAIGKGTYLLVYEEFNTFINRSDVVCEAKVQAAQNVTLFWEFQGQRYDGNISSVIPDSDNSYRILSVLTKGTQLCKTAQNRTITCKLQYMGQSLEERSAEVTCTGDPPQPPVILYTLILGNSLLILFSIIIIFFWVKKKRRNRRVRVRAPYPKSSAPSRTNYNG